ncbi:MAG: RHS repeat-associated core domain-containing protein, partial [Luteibacter jiangsuensis]
RLTETRDPSDDVVLHRYTYDATGNRTSLAIGGATDHYVYAADSHHLTTADGTLRRYDAAGNTIAIGALESIHDATGQLASIRQAGTALASYRYNGDGQRVARAEGNHITHTVYDEAGHWLGDYDAAGKAIAQAIWLGNYPVGLIVGGHVLYIEPDHLGTPRAVIDPVRNVAVWRWKLEGEAFGADRPNEDPDGDGQTFTFDLRFPGQRYDAVSGLHYNYFRYFDPASGRYIQSDPIGLAGGISTYAYVANNPYLLIDPHGLWSFSLEAYLGVGGGFNVAWSNGTLELTGRIGVGLGAGATFDAVGKPSAHASSCGSGYIGRTSLSASAGAGIGPFSFQGNYTAASENVFDLSQKRYATDWGTRGYKNSSFVYGVDGSNPTKIGVRVGASLGVDFGSYSNW